MDVTAERDTFSHLSQAKGSEQPAEKKEPAREEKPIVTALGAEENTQLEKKQLEKKEQEDKEKKEQEDKEKKDVDMKLLSTPSFAENLKHENREATDQGKRKMHRSKSEEELEEENLAADVLARNMQREDSNLPFVSKSPVSSPRVTKPTTAPLTTHPVTGTSSEEKKLTGEEIVRLSGKWNGKEWTGEWFSTNLPGLKAPFTYTPDLSHEMDEEMEDLPCSVCNGADPEGFLFCDLCNGGFHARCCNVDTLPGEDDDWHCPNCSRVLRRYGNELPPSRSWKGWFQMVMIADKPGVKTQEEFDLAFEYLIVDESTEKQKGDIQVAKITGKGFNKFGNFEINGTLSLRPEGYFMECDKKYVKGGKKKKRNKLNKRKSERARVSARPSSARGSEGVMDRDDLMDDESDSPLSGRGQNGKRKGNHSPVGSAAGTPSSTTHTTKRRRSEQGGTSSSSSSSSGRPAKISRESSRGVDEDTRGRSGSNAPLLQDPSKSSLKRSGDKNSELVQSLRRRITELEGQLQNLSSSRKTLVVTDLDCYISFPSTELCGKRLPKFWEQLRVRLPQETMGWLTEVPRAPMNVVLTAHDVSYVTKLLDNAASSDDEHLGLMSSLKSAGGVCAAVKRVVVDPTWNKPPMFASLDPSMDVAAQNALCVVSPPGHSVGVRGVVARANGSELMNGVLNSAAIGAIYAVLNFRQRVAVVDIGLLPGAGTEDILERFSTSSASHKDNVFYGSVETDSFKPSSSRSFSSKVVRIPKASSPDQWRAACTSVLDAVQKFQPTLVLISAGFDWAKENIASKDYKWFSNAVLDICPRTVSVLEAGLDDKSEVDGFLAHAQPFVGS